MAPSAAETQGVHPTANAAPNTKDVTYFDPNFLRTAILWSRFKKAGVKSPRTKRPKRIIMTPPILPSHV